MKAIYKCRLCGEQYKPTVTLDAPQAIVASSMLACGKDFVCDKGYVAKIFPHACSNGDLGLADFQGFIKEDSDE